MDKCCIKAFLVATFVGADDTVELDEVEQTSTVGQPISMKTSAPETATTMRQRDVVEKEDDGNLFDGVEDDEFTVSGPPRLLMEKRHLQKKTGCCAVSCKEIICGCTYTFILGSYWGLCCCWCCTVQDLENSCNLTDTMRHR